MASAYLKGTRKTYSFEERKILISLINKYEIIEGKKSDSVSICKRKSAWSLVAEEYNSLVGPQGARSAVQLRRCWENMKACKRNREEKKTRTKAVYQWTKDETRGRDQCWEVAATCGQNTSEAPTSTGTVGLPPNVLFEPTDSEPFTLQSVCTTRLQKPSCSKDADSCRDMSYGDTFKQIITDKNKYEAFVASCSPMVDCQVKSVKTNADPVTINQSAKDTLEKAHVNSGLNNSHILTSPSVMQQYNRKRKSAQREEELHMLALSEAQMKVDIAAMLKEEARIKLEEAHYRKEEARLRMLLFTYKLDRVK
ncbi:myb/SANT-like DNA-binding domain-containing protein 3 [Odontomachus brunneus]|uniref:myb/SANT-like DNA-binding domain-containing protein 3 n=1 Tax=Odontomachus brunneus TaxID=486640 RepID=UPI0013F2368B|nr:myb/SANT-like DNA-binding domain-containing protein 3 [Odontomachus brunneus]